MLRRENPLTFPPYIYRTFLSAISSIFCFSSAMRIRDRSPATDRSVSSSSSSSLSSHSSSITASQSLVSSQGSSISCQSSPFTTALPRCRGLDLLVKAIHQVNAGSVIGVPYIQRCVTIRRRRRSGRIDFDPFVLDVSPEKKRDRIAKNVCSNKKVCRRRSDCTDELCL